MVSGGTGPAVVLPRDAGPHSDPIEWWYVNGHLRSRPGDAEFGFELAIFRLRPPGQNAFRSIGHFAISDFQHQTFSHQGRAADMPPERSSGLDVEGWTMTHAANGGEALRAKMPGYALDLRVWDRKPPTLHAGGYLPVGIEGGTFYYSRTRLLTEGSLVREAAGAPIAVTGSAWLDHQWGTFVGAHGWDWFGLQLVDDTELMVFIFRAPPGESPRVFATRTQSDGTAVDIPPSTVHVEVRQRWTSPHSGATYPAGWRLRAAGLDAPLEIRPKLADQEMYFPGSPRGLFGGPYWEGAVSVYDEQDAPVGEGYVELSNYQ